MNYPRRILSFAILGLAAFSMGALPLDAGDRDRGDRSRHDSGRDSHWRDNRHRGNDRNYRNDHYDRGRHYDRYHFNRNPGVVFSPRRPGTNFSVSIGTHYHSPRYYRPPVAIHSHRYYGPRYGTIVTRLPVGCERVYYGSRTYYHFNNVYYAPSSAGYTVVDPSTISQQSAPTAAETRESIRRAMQSANTSADQAVTSPAPVNTEMVAPLEYLPSGYRTHYVNGAAVYEVDGQFYRWNAERHAYIATPAPEIEE